MFFHTCVFQVFPLVRKIQESLLLRMCDTPFSLWKPAAFGLVCSMRCCQRCYNPNSIHAACSEYVSCGGCQKCICCLVSETRAGLLYQLRRHGAAACRTHGRPLGAKRRPTASALMTSVGRGLADRVAPPLLPVSISPGLARSTRCSCAAGTWIASCPPLRKLDLLLRDLL